MYLILYYIYAKKANYIPRTCNNKVKYYIKYNSEEENQSKNYGIEVCETGCHITSSDETDAVLSITQSEKLDKIINKYSD